MKTISVKTGTGSRFVAMLTNGSSGHDLCRLKSWTLSAGFRKTIRLPRAAIIVAIAMACTLSGQPAESNDTETCKPISGSDAPRLPVSSVIPAEIFQALVGWIALNTSYDVSVTYRSPPTLSFCVVDEMVSYEGDTLIIEKGLQAAFDYPNRHIYLVRPWSHDNLFDRSVLLHELIHDVQLDNRDWNCIAAPEFEAYLLQDKWLRENGIIHPFNWHAIFQISRCTQD